MQRVTECYNICLALSNNGIESFAKQLLGTDVQKTFYLELNASWNYTAFIPRYLETSWLFYLPLSGTIFFILLLFLQKRFLQLLAILQQSVVHTH